MPIAHQYVISPKNLTAHLFEVCVTVARPDIAGQALRFPAWIPGSYVIRDMAQHVGTMRAESDGETVELLKTDKNTWLAGVCTGPLSVVMEIYAFDLSVRGAYLDTNHGFFDGACVFPAVVGQEDVQCDLNIMAPEDVGSDWRVATSMRSIDAPRYSFGQYSASNYAELIDHPVEMGDIHIGEFEVEGIPHSIAVYGEMNFDMARVCHD
ncbi:MAG: M61 family metallopeptidase, partial [Woeseiales bacterium]